MEKTVLEIGALVTRVANLQPQIDIFNKCVALVHKRNKEMSWSMATFFLNNLFPRTASLLPPS